MKTLSIVKTVLATAAVMVAVTGTVFADEAVYEKALRSTVWVVTENSSGSGVLIDAERKLVVTNFHVVGELEKVMVCFPAFEDDRLIAQRSHYRKRLKKIGIPGRVTVRDPRRDLALIELESVPEGAKALSLAKSSPSPGAKIHSVGNPGASEALWVYTSGTVRQVYPTKVRLPNGCVVDVQVIEAQSPVNPGDSGGPAVNDDGELVGIVQSFQQDARLVSHCIDAGEVKALLSGDIKTIDQRVRKALEAAGWKYSTSLYGIFRLDFGSPEEEEDAHRVCVDSSTDEFGALDIREIYSVVHASNRAADEKLANFLLQGNIDYKFGAWGQKKIGNKYFVVFSVKVDADTEPEKLQDAIRAVLQVVTNTRDEIVRLATAADLDPDVLVGDWRAEQPRKDGSATKLQLQLGKDGAFVWDEQSFTARGNYVLTDGAITVTMDGKQRQLGLVQSVDQGQLVLRMGKQVITFVRRQADAESAPIWSLSSQPAKSR